jgi:cell division protein FtsL
MSSPYLVRRVVVNAYLVRERDRRRLRELAGVVAAVLPVSLALVAIIWVQVEILRTGYRIHDLERQLDALTRQERTLRLEASYLASPQRVERRAVEELGMQPPDLDQILFAEELER